MVALVRVALAEVGEIEAALSVEHDVVRRRQFVAVALAVEDARFPGLWVDALDRAVLVVGRRAGRHPARRSVIGAAAIVANVERAVGAGGDTVGAAAGLADLALAAVRHDAGDLAAGNLAEDHRTVCHPYRPFGKPQTIGDGANIAVGHASSPYFVVPASAGTTICLNHAFTLRISAAHLSSTGNVLSAFSGGQAATTRVTPMSA